MNSDDQFVIKYGRDYGLDIEDMCAQLNYFFVFPFQVNKFNSAQNKLLKPIILTFQDDDTQMKQLMEDYKSKLPKFKDRKYLSFTLSNGKLIDQQKSVVGLKKSLGKKRLDGLVLFLKEDQQRRIRDQNIELGIQSDQDSYSDECCLTEYYEDKTQIQNYNMNISFLIPNTKYILSFGVVNQEILQSLMSKFYKQVQRVFKLKLNNDLVDEIYTLTKANKKIKINKTWFKSIKNIDHLANNTILNITLKQKKQFKVNVAYPNNKIIIYKENSSEFIQECFQEVEFMTFKTLYESKLQDRKKSKDGTRCLKVMDMLIKEYENLSKLSIFFKGTTKEIIKLVGRVVSEKMYFYKHIGEVIEKDQDFKIQQFILAPSHQSQTKEDKLRERIRSQIKMKAQNAKDAHFKDVKNVEPIFVYTCEETHNYYTDQYGNVEKKSQPIYVIVNRHLRNTNLLEVNVDDISKDWRNKFTSSLIKQLGKIKKSQKSTVYRGINFDLKVNVGDTITFKSFTSTSKLREKAQIFLFVQNDKNKISQQFFTLLQIEIFSGKSIKLMSDFTGQQQVLLMPYSQFKVTSKKMTKLGGQYVMQIKMEELRQQLSSSKYPKTKANFILWVDDKLDQGKNLFKNIKTIEQPTILIQLQSTQALRDWLNQQKNAKILLDQTANFVFITNMTREGNGLAGIEGIIELQKYKKIRQIPILMYIGNKKLAIQKLNAHRDKIKGVQQIKVSTYYSQIQDFLSANVNMNFIDQNKIEPNNNISNFTKSQVFNPSINNKPQVQSEIKKSNNNCEIM